MVEKLTPKQEEARQRDEAVRAKLAQEGIDLSAENVSNGPDDRGSAFATEEMMGQFPLGRHYEPYGPVATRGQISIEKIEK